MTTLERKLSADLHFDSAIPLVVAVSGGADSTALLDALVRRYERSHKDRLTVAHLNHSLRGAESDEDQAFVAALAARHGLTCLVEREQVAEIAAREGRNLEAVARERRYDFLARAALSVGATAVVTAHTRDDQVETQLLRLIRGAGPAGLRGIEPERELAAGIKLIRPLLAATRAEVLEHCAHYGIDYRTDSSNFSLSLSRNRLRLEVLPILRTLNPRFDEAMLRTTSLIGEDEEHLSAEAELLFAASNDPSSGALDVGRMAAAAAPLRRRALRKWLGRQRGDLRRIDAVHLGAIEALILRGHSGQRIEIPGGGQIFKEFTRLVFLSAGRAEIPSPTPLIEGTESSFGAYRLKLQRYLRRDEAEAALEAALEAAKIFDEVGVGAVAILRESPALDDLTIRARRDGDAYIPAGAEKPVKLKKIMLRVRLPHHLRAGYPLLATAAGEIVWGPLLPIARGFQPVADEECAVVSVRRVDRMQPDGLIGRL